MEAFPGFKWVFPQAKASVPAALSFGPHKSNQWFDLWNVHDYKDREELQADGLRSSVRDMINLISVEAEHLGGRFDRIILAGISQGGATLLHTILNLNLEGANGKRGLCAFLGFSCRLPFIGRSLPELRQVLGLKPPPSGDEEIRNTPVLLEHCVDDPLVLVKNGRALRDTWRDLGAKVEWREYEKGGHWFQSPQGMDDVREFLQDLTKMSDEK